MLQAEPSAEGSSENTNPEPSAGNNPEGSNNTPDEGGKAASSSEGSQGGGKQSTNGVDWSAIKEQLPEDLRNDKSMETITSIEGLAKSYVHAQKAVGKDKIPVPDKHASPDDWQQIFKKLGNPESLEDYKVNIETGEEGSKIDEQILGEAKKAAHEAGVLPWQFEKIVNTFNKVASERVRGAQMEDESAQKEAINKLKEEWGSQFDTQVRRANAAFKHFLPDKEARQALIDSGVGSDPRLVKLLANASKALSEDDFIGQGDGVLSGMTKEEALQKAREIQGNPKHPYRDPSHPNHKSAKEEVANLYKVAFPE